MLVSKTAAFSIPFAEQPSPLPDQQCPRRCVHGPQTFSPTRRFPPATRRPRVYVLAPRRSHYTHQHQLRRPHLRLITPRRLPRIKTQSGNQ